MTHDPDWLKFDRQHIWHPYSSINPETPAFPVESANGVRLRLANGKELIDGMSSWWCVVHGYNHPVLNQAINQQLEKMAHVMFGGLTHEPASRLAEKLVEITPESLQTVFLCDSGSVSVEVAMKMAIQYWNARGKPGKQKMLAIRSGYHGDTTGAMSVCDPVTGMHSLFSEVLMKQHFVAAPTCRFGEPCSDDDIIDMSESLSRHHDEIAAVILEPIVQGAGGMRFYSAEYLKKVRNLCDQHDVLLIADEIATGFGRSGKMFACEHADIQPDILCLGKSLTGGYMTLAATLTTQQVSEAICNAEPGVFMHGPTFMANPLACAVANASIDLLHESDWQQRVADIEQGLLKGLAPCRDLDGVADVRVLGGIGVVELEKPVDMSVVQPAFVDEGVWVRPFGKLIYLMPPYVISEADLNTLTQSVYRIVTQNL